MGKQRIIHQAIGINWCWYHVYELNKAHKAAYLIGEWREHLYDSDRNVGAPSHEGAKDYQVISGHDISQWHKDGRPGGFDGCRDNYRRTPKIVVDGAEYKIV